MGHCTDLIVDVLKQMISHSIKYYASLAINENNIILK